MNKRRNNRGLRRNSHTVGDQLAAKLGPAGFEQLVAELTRQAQPTRRRRGSRRPTRAAGAR